MSLVAYGDSDSESEVEEGEGEPATEADKSDVRKLLGLLPPPKGSKHSGKHPVRISLPTLKSGRDSDDEEEESAQVKRVKIQGGASRLTALLPQPKSNNRQLGTATRPTTTQTMVPYTLSKRRQDTIKAEKLKSVKAKSRGRQPSATGDGSDSDEEPTSFFSHLEERSALQGSESSTVVAPLKVSSPVGSTSSPAGPLSGPVSGSREQNINHTTHTTTTTTIDQPGHSLSSDPSFSTSSETYYPTHTLGGSQDQSGSHQMSGSQDQHQMSGSQDQHQAVSGYSWEHFSNLTANSAPYTAQPYTPPQQYQSGSQAVGDPSAVSEECASGEGGEDGGGGGGGVAMQETGPGVIIDKDALRRLAGGSHKRKGREDALNNIVDILGDDVMEDVRVYRRHYGEDPSIAKLYKVDGSKLKTPTGNQKRKHQITWLAHEAKERELELQKQWSVGNQARKDSRTKYGF